MVKTIEIHENALKKLAYLKIDGKVEGTFKIITKRTTEGLFFEEMPQHILEKVSDSLIPDLD